MGRRANRTKSLLLGACLAGALAAAQTPEGAVAKPPPAADPLDSADAIVLGRIHDIRGTSDARIVSASLVAYAWFKGRPEKREIPIKLYAAGAREGLASLWLLKKLPGEQLEETYPWLRREPPTWPHLPRPLRDEVFKAVRHAASEPVGGLRLRLMWVPAPAGQPLEVWLGLENASSRNLRVPLGGPDRPGTVRFTVTTPDGTTRSVPLLRDTDLRALEGRPDTRYEALPPSALRLVSRPRESASVPTQVVLAESTRPGRYTIGATLAVAGEKAGAWSGEVSVRLTATLKAR